MLKSEKEWHEDAEICLGSLNWNFCYFLKTQRLFLNLRVCRFLRIFVFSLLFCFPQFCFSVLCFPLNSTDHLSRFGSYISSSLSVLSSTRHAVLSSLHFCFPVYTLPVLFCQSPDPHVLRLILLPLVFVPVIRFSRPLHLLLVSLLPCIVCTLMAASLLVWINSDPQMSTFQTD